MSLPLIITGMHRSGTSLTASFIKAIGVNIGDSFFEADDHNIKGYFEDVDFLEFQRSVLQNSCHSDESGWHDWGWTENEYLDYTNFYNYIETAKTLIDRRQENLTVWGWKDPRTTLMLDFWHNLLPEAKYLLVYRFPWDVVDSIARLEAPIFAEHPDYPLKIWAFYNRHLLKFYNDHSEKCILFNVNAWLQQPNKLVELLIDKLNANYLEKSEKGNFEQIYEGQIFKSLNWDDKIIHKLAEVHPEYFSLLEDLDRIADIPSGFSLKSNESGMFDRNYQNQEDTIENFQVGSFNTLENELEEKITEPSAKSFLNDEDEIVVSVIIPCYNQGEFILEAVSSVEACQDRVYEIVIVNDCSTEKLTIKVLNYLRDRGYNVIDHDVNQGLAEARNTGVKKAKGQYILPLDSDNKIRPEYMLKAIDILDKCPEIGVVYGNTEFFGERTGVWEVPEFNVNKIAARNYIDACAVYRKQVWENCGGYDSKIPGKLGYEDWDFWLGAVEKGWKFHHIPEVLFDYRVRSDSMVSLCRIPENHERLVHYICAKHLDIYTTNFASILAEKESVLLKEEMRCQEMEMKLQKTQLAFEESQEELDRIRFAWEESQADIQRIQGAWEDAESEVKRIQTAWEDAQLEVQTAYIASEKAQSELRRIQGVWEEAQSEVQRIQTAWKNSQTELQLTSQEWQRSQSEVERIQTAWENAQEQLRQTHAEWEKSQQSSQEEVQRIQAAWEEAQSEVQRIQGAWGSSQEQLRLTHGEWEQAQQQLQLTQAEWEKAQQQLQLTNSEWQRSQQQSQLTQAEWEKAQQQAHLIHVAWEQAQQQVHSLHTAWEQAQQQVQNIQTAWEQAQQQAQQQTERSQSQLTEMQTEWQRSQSQYQHLLTQWEQIQHQLQITHAELQHSRTIINQIESSKFWKIRTAWIRFKQAIGLSKNIEKQ